MVACTPARVLLTEERGTCAALLSAELATGVTTDMFVDPDRIDRVISDPTGTRYLHYNYGFIDTNMMKVSQLPEDLEAKHWPPDVRCVPGTGIAIVTTDAGTFLANIER